jgi:hypothetical protein
MARKLLSLKGKSFHILVLAVALLAMIFAANEVQNAQATSSWSQGCNAGRNDRQDGNAYNDYCPPDNPEGRCAIYQAGYFAGWHAYGLVHPRNEVPRNDQDFSDRTNNDDD